MATVSNNDPQNDTTEVSPSTRRDRRAAQPATHLEPADAEVMAEASKIYPDTLETPPTADEIAVEAYAIYLARGREDGHDQDDWLDAERRLNQRRRPTQTE